MIRTYPSPIAFRTALEARLKDIAQREGVDLQRIRRKVAFDRYLARVFREEGHMWALKGGYAMELQFHAARTTKDIDLTLGSTKTLPDVSSDQNLRILDALQAAAEFDLQDFFTFTVGQPKDDLDGPPYGGARYTVTAKIGGKDYVTFHLDVGVGDVILGPLRPIKGQDWLGFAGVEPHYVFVISWEQHFAEKIHAYTLPRQTPNSRVKDLVDMVLLLDTSGLDFEKTRKAVIATFGRRQTHDIPKSLEAPPEEWRKPFASMAQECRMSEDLAEAFSKLKNFYDQLSLIGT